LIFNNVELCDLFDIKLFIDTPDDIRFIRRLQEIFRSVVEFTVCYYAIFQTVRPMHIKFVEPCRERADIILPDNLNPIAIEIISALISEKLNNSN
jgi:uridine kinase